MLWWCMVQKVSSAGLDTDSGWLSERVDPPVKHMVCWRDCMDWYPIFYWKAQKRNKSYSKLTRFRRASFWASQFRSAISWPGSNQILIFGGPNLKKGIRVPSSQAKSYNIRYSAVFGHVPIVLTKNEVNNWLKQMVYKISKKTALAWIPMMGNILDISGDIIYIHTHIAQHIYIIIDT